MHAHVVRCFVVAIGAIVATVGSAASNRVLTATFSADFPSGWTVKKEEGASPTYEATSPGAEAKRILTLTYCERSDQGCAVTCSAAAVRQAFFYFFEGNSKVKYTERPHSDGISEFRAVGPHAPGWIATSVLCGERVVVHVGSISFRSDVEASADLDGLVRSIGWR